MLIPFLHRIVVKPEKVEEVDDQLRRAKAAGIILELDKREQKAVEVGVVVSIGDTFGKGFETTVLPKVGDKVYFAKYSGKEIKEKEEVFLILNDEDVVAIIIED